MSRCQLCSLLIIVRFLHHNFVIQCSTKLRMQIALYRELQYTEEFISSSGAFDIFYSTVDSKVTVLEFVKNTNTFEKEILFPIDCSAV